MEGFRLDIWGDADLFAGQRQSIMHDVYIQRFGIDARCQCFHIDLVFFLEQVHQRIAPRATAGKKSDSPRWFLPSAEPFEGFVDLAPEHFHFFKRIPLSHGTLPPRDIIAMNLATEHWLSSRKPAQLNPKFGGIAFSEDDKKSA